MQIFVISVKDFEFNLDLIFNITLIRSLLTIDIYKDAIFLTLLSIYLGGINKVKDVKSTSVCIESLF